MSSLGMFSARVILVASLCVASFAFGQTAVNSATINSRSMVTSSSVVPALFVHEFDKHDKDKHDCDGDRRRDSHCQAVPEGGAAAMYLLLAGLTCFGAMVLRSRSQVNAPQSS
jgi:hypothetical protein